MLDLQFNSVPHSQRFFSNAICLIFGECRIQIKYNTHGGVIEIMPEKKELDGESITFSLISSREQGNPKLGVMLSGVTIVLFNYQYH